MKTMTAKQVVKKAVQFAQYAKETGNMPMLARCKQTIREFFPVRHKNITVIT